MSNKQPSICPHPTHPHILSRRGNPQASAQTHLPGSPNPVGGTCHLDPTLCLGPPLTFSVLPKFMSLSVPPLALGSLSPRAVQEEEEREEKPGSHVSECSPEHLGLISSTGRVGCWWPPRAPLLPVTRSWPQSPSGSEAGARTTGSSSSPGPVPISDFPCLSGFYLCGFHSL